MKTRVLVPFGAALAAAIAGVSYAAIPSATGVISACKDNKGTLRVIDTDAGQTCAGNQQPLTWSQQGPTGTPGVSGYEVVETTEWSQWTGHGEVYRAYCPAGKKAIAGGGSVAALTHTHLRTSIDRPGSDGSHWVFAVAEEEPIDNANYHVTAFAVCANVG